MLFLWVLLLLPPPSAAGPPENIFTQQGSSVTLPIKELPKEGNVYVRWYFCPSQNPGQEQLLIWKHPKQDTPKNEAQDDFKNRVSLSKDSSLILSPVQDTDFISAGFFRCEIQDYKTKTEIEYRLHRVNMPTELTLLAGESLSLSCQTDTQSVPSAKFTRPQDATYDKLSGNSVFVSSTSTQHSGTWTCEVTTDRTKLKATTTVTIIDLSPTSPDDGYTFMSSKSPPMLPCSFTSEIPWLTVEQKGLRNGSWTFTPLNQNSQTQLLYLQLQPSPAWRRPNSYTPNKPLLKEQQLKSQQRLKDYLSVQVSEVSPEIRGTYTCSLEFNSSRTLNQTVHLEVLEVLSSPAAAREGVKALVGDMVNLTCSLGHALPWDLTLEWIPPPSSAFSPGSAPHPEHLSIPAARLQDSGTWTCALKRNGKTLTSATVTLKIERLVDIWVIVVISSAAGFVLLLVITVFIVRRQKQSVKLRRRKTKFCCCENPKTKAFYKT